MRYQMKQLPKDQVEAAWEMAEKYRDLNQPDEAESICHDILDVVPNHQAALRTLGLSLTDRFPSRWTELHKQALSVFSRLESQYERVYYAGVAWERRGRAQLEEVTGRGAYDAFTEALELFQRASELAPDRAEPVLRYNRGARALSTHPVLLAAAERDSAETFDPGDGPHSVYPPARGSGAP
jgi:tetratricopeptide (TPR) repeat protein